MATAVKRVLSGSTSGKAIKIATTATPGTLIHTAVAGTTPGTYDEIWLWGFNSVSSDVLLTVEFGGVSVPDDIMYTTLLGRYGWIPLAPGYILQNSLVVRAFANQANVATIIGFVNNMTD